VTAIPATFTIDADGVLEDQHVGDADIEGKLKKLVARAAEGTIANCAAGAVDKAQLAWRELITRSPFGRAVSQNGTGQKRSTPRPSSHKTCNSWRGPILSAIETGLQSRWVVNAG
jgi:hypothetical protein